MEQRPRQAPPLVLMAAKSWTGHAEPAAGIVGLVHAQAALSQAAALPVLHLGLLNPYVTGAMEMSGNQKMWSAPRQPAQLTLKAATQPDVIGMSAFAFQGTNAHVILAAPGIDGASMAKPSGPWQQQRYWLAPRRHAGRLISIAVA